MRKVLICILCVSFLHVNAQQTQRLRDSINKYQYLNPNRAIEFGIMSSFAPATHPIPKW